MAIISYILECRAFCETASEEKLSDSEVVLWHALFNLVNLRASSNRWPEAFIPLTNAKVLSMTPWGSGNAAVEKLRRTRDRLIGRGLIAYEPGERRKRAPMYRLNYFHPVSEGFTHKYVDKAQGNAQGKQQDKAQGNGVDIKEKDQDPYPDWYPDTFPDFVPDTHGEEPAAANARAGWFDPGNPEQPDDGAWHHSTKARAATAQRVLQWAKWLKPNGEDVHGLLCDLMGAGMHPAELVELAENCPNMDEYEARLLRRADRAGLELGPEREEVYQLKLRYGLKAADARQSIRMREWREEMAR